MPHIEELTLVAAIGRNGQLGRNNDLLWKLPEDMRLFRQRTMGRPIIMGRKTWDSLGQKALPGRISFIVSRSAEISGREQASTIDSNVHWSKSFVEAYDLAKWISATKGIGQPCCIGGAQIYAEALRYATDLCLTDVDDDPEADVYFPSFDRSDWVLVEEIPLGTAPGATFRHFHRKKHL